MVYEELTTVDNLSMFFFIILITFLFTLGCNGVGGNIFKRFNKIGGLIFVLIFGFGIYVLSIIPSILNSTIDADSSSEDVIREVLVEDNYENSIYLLSLALGLGIIVGSWLSLDTSSKFVFGLGRKIDPGFSKLPSNYPFTPLLTGLSSKKTEANVRIHSSDAIYEGILDSSSINEDSNAIVISDPKIVDQTTNKKEIIGSKKLMFVQDFIKRIEVLSESNVSDYGQKSAYSFFMFLGGLLTSVGLLIQGDWEYLSYEPFFGALIFSGIVLAISIVEKGRIAIKPKGEVKKEKKKGKAAKEIKKKKPDKSWMMEEEPKEEITTEGPVEEFDTELNSLEADLGDKDEEEVSAITEEKKKPGEWMEKDAEDTPIDEYEEVKEGEEGMLGLRDEDAKDTDMDEFEEVTAKQAMDDHFGIAKESTDEDASGVIELDGDYTFEEIKEMYNRGDLDKDTFEDLKSKLEYQGKIKPDKDKKEEIPDDDQVLL